MEIFGFIVAVIIGAGLALYRERKFQTKLDFFKSSQSELAKINKRLDNIVVPNKINHKPLELETEQVRKDLDMLATVKFVNAYIRDMDEAVYRSSGRSSGFLTSTPYSDKEVPKASTESSDCYTTPHFPSQAGSYA